MADNLSENGLPPNDVDVSGNRLNNPAVLNSEYRAEDNTQKVNSPAVLDSEFHISASKQKVSSAGVVIEEEVGKNTAMFL